MAEKRKVISNVGLVLSGGGGKGAYETGVFKAISESDSDIMFDAVSGTSVGALNAALFLTVDSEESEKIWSGIRRKDILSSRNDIIVDKKNLKPKFKDIIDSYLKERICLFSRTGLVRIIRNNNIPDKIKEKKPEGSYVACFNKSDFKVEYKPIYKKNMSPNYVEDLLLASSAIPVAFSEETIDEGNTLENSEEKKKWAVLSLLAGLISPVLGFFASRKAEAMINPKYCDGGVPVFGDNTPIKPLYDDGLRTFVVVHLGNKIDDEDIVKKRYDSFKGAKFIHVIPSSNIGGFIEGTLNFEKDKINSLIQLGYNDGRKYLNNIFTVVKKLKSNEKFSHYYNGTYYENYNDLLTVINH